MRKYLFSGAVVTAILGVFGLLPRTISGPRNLRLLLAWAGWGLGLAAAILAVREESEEVSEYYELRDAERAAKRR
ncbi:MAG: hypothetical protein ACOYBP_06195 [Microbacteriaceae bacterium]